MKVAYLIILICTLPLLFAVPYIISKEHAPEAEIDGAQSLVYLAQEKKLPKPGSETNMTEFINALNTHGFVSSQYTDPEKPNEFNGLKYYIRVPDKPWPEGIKFPLVMHFIESVGIPQSVISALEGNNKFDFPAIHLIPLLPNNAIWSYYQETQSPQALWMAIEALGRIMVEYPVDKTKLYVLGCGENAYGALGAAKFYPDLFAGVIAHSAIWTTSDAPAFANTPMLMMTGTANTQFPRMATKNLAEAIKQQGGKLIYKELESMPHNCGYKAMYSDKVWKWLFSNKNEAIENPVE